MLRTEWLKLRTTRTPWLMLAAAQLLIVIGASGPLLRNGANDPATTTGALAHVGLAALIPLLLGIMAVAGEYRHHTITDTYLATPRRGQVIGAKLAVYTTTGFGFGFIGTVTALATTASWYAARGGSVDLASSDVWRTIGGGIIWNALFDRDRRRSGVDSPRRRARRATRRHQRRPVATVQRRYRPRPDARRGHQAAPMGGRDPAGRLRRRHHRRRTTHQHPPRRGLTNPALGDQRQWIRR
jgi:hypothetical protein